MILLTWGNRNACWNVEVRILLHQMHRILHRNRLIKKKLKKEYLLYFKIEKHAKHFIKIFKVLWVHLDYCQCI